MELTIEQKKRLVKEILGYKLQNKKSEQRNYPPAWNLFAIEPIKNHYAIVTHDNGKVELVVAKENSDSKMAWHRFCPEKDIDIAMFMMDSLMSVSGRDWFLAFHNGHRYKYAIYDTPQAEFECYADDIKELIIRACLWWLDNKAS